MNELVQVTGISACIILVYMLCWFVLAQILKNNSIVDIAWGLGFTAVTLTLGLLDIEQASLAWIMLLAMIWIWGIRLSSHIGYRNWGKPEDFRYQNFRLKWGKHPYWGAFLQVFVLQGFIMWLVLMPVYIAHLANKTDEMNHPGWMQWLGLLIFCVGFLFEAIGDYQLLRFKSKPENKGKIIQSGLWKYTRHPNYFGETALWWGIAVYVLPYSFGWMGLLAPVIMTYLLTKVSGVPMLEEKYKDNPEFKAFAERTPAFFPKFW